MIPPGYHSKGCPTEDGEKARTFLPAASSVNTYQSCPFLQARKACYHKFHGTPEPLNFRLYFKALFL